MLNLHLGNSDTYMPILALLIFIFIHKHVHGLQKKFLPAYIVGSLIIFGATNLMRARKIPNLFLYHFYTWFELVLVSYFIISITYPAKKKLLYGIIFTVFTAFCLLNILLWEPLSGFNSHTSTAANIILLLLSMMYMLQLTRKDDIMYFQKIAAFWFVTAFLVSSALSIPLMIKYVFYTNNPKNFSAGNNLWSIMDLTYIVKFVLICVGMLCYKFYPQQASSSK